MLHRFVRSTVRTAPRPYLIVLVPWLCSFRRQRVDVPTRKHSRYGVRNFASIAIMSSKWP